VSIDRPTAEQIAGVATRLGYPSAARDAGQFAEVMSGLHPDAFRLEPTMPRPQISTEDVSYRKRVRVLDTDMAYVDVGEGDPIVFLHGNPTPSYLWRNIIPYVLPVGRCLAPDYVGMGNSGPAPDGSYRFFDQQRYLDAWFETMSLTENVILVVHDWGSALGFSWAYRHQDRVKAIVYMESLVRPFRSWDEWPEATRRFFQAQRSEAGEDLILQKNLFIEYLLPLRNIASEALETYRRHYRNPGPSRQPMLSWTRDLPIAGEPQDVVDVVEQYSQWLAESPIPKLFIDAEPAGFLIGPVREFCRAWPNQETITVDGAHFVQEDSPDAVGEATARFVAKVLAAGSASATTSSGRRT
jgi:haloalkane dehalogenase